MARVTKVRVTFPVEASKLIIFTKGVLQSVKTNPKFPALNFPVPADPDPNVPTYTQIETAVLALEAQQIKVINRAPKAETSLRDDLQRVLDRPVTGMLVKAANYVQERCGTNVTDMLSSGFNTTDQPQRVDTLPQPEFLKVISRAKRELTFAVETVAKAKGYGWNLIKADNLWQPLPNVVPIQKFSSAADCKFTNLESGTRYLCTAFAMGTRDTVSTETDPIQVICL